LDLVLKLRSKVFVQKCRFIIKTHATRAWIAQTVEDTKGFTDDDGMVSFVITDNNIILDIDADAARRAYLKINSKHLIHEDCEVRALTRGLNGHLW
jgi:hypothetical protein